MKYYSGLDVSLKTTFISVIDEKQNIVMEGEVATDADTIFAFLSKNNMKYEKIGIESGQLSIHLTKSLRAKGLDVTCVDARHMAAALAARINKNDKNDARGIAKMMRVGLYKETLVKSDESCQIKIAIGSRKQLVNNKRQLMGTVRGLLKIHGIKIRSNVNAMKFVESVENALKDLDEVSKLSLIPLLRSLETIEESKNKLDELIIKLCKDDPDCKRLMTIPGVGVITAVTYKAAVDDPDRFEDSKTVGAYFGLTPRQYASGEVNRHGSISKMGHSETRMSLYEAAHSLLVVSKKKNKIKAWGLKIVKKKGTKKAIVAVARKLAVVMHRMLKTQTDFCFV